MVTYSTTVCISSTSAFAGASSSRLGFDVSFGRFWKIINFSFQQERGD